MKASRRDFLRGAVAVAAAGAMEGCATATAPGALDPYAIGVISDIHTGSPWAKQKYRTGREYPWLPEMPRRMVQEILALPNPPANVIGLDRDIGWGLFRTTPTKAVLECMARDFYFPMKRPAAERPAAWDGFVSDWAGRRMTFEFA